MTAATVAEKDLARMFHRFLGITLVAIVVVACGGGFAEEPAPPETKTTSVTTTTTPDDSLGGFGTPAKVPGEFENLDSPRPVRAELRLDPNGCWYVDFGTVRSLVAFPVGFEIPFSDDPTVVRSSDEGTTFASGMLVDGAARQVWFDSLPGGSDGRWSNYVAFCDPSEQVLAVFEEMTPAADPSMLDPAQLETLVESAQFTKAWPCGYGWATSTEDESVALFIYQQAEVPELPAGTEITLPDESWSTRLVVGKFLFVNHCDDVFEPWEPESVVAAEWELTGGTLQLVDRVSGDEAVGSVRAVLLDATFTSQTGRQITFERIDLENRSFGFLAG